MSGAESPDLCCECSKLNLCWGWPLTKYDVLSPVNSNVAVSDQNTFQAETNPYVLDFHRITSSEVWDYDFRAVCFIVGKWYIPEISADSEERSLDWVPEYRIKSTRKINLSVFQAISTKPFAFANGSAVWLNSALCLSLKSCFGPEWNSSLSIYICRIEDVVVVPRTGKEVVLISQLTIWNFPHSNLWKLYWPSRTTSSSFRLIPLQSRWRMLVGMPFSLGIHTEPLCFDFYCLTGDR